MLQRKKPLRRHSPLRPSRSRATRDDAAAAKLWSLLKDREVAGLKFRQHEIIGPYVVDFVCPGARVVLLLDDAEPCDQAQWLRQNGYRVLAFPAGEVLSNPQGVLDAIAQAFELRIVTRKS